MQLIGFLVHSRAAILPLSPCSLHKTVACVSPEPIGSFG